MEYFAPFVGRLLEVNGPKVELRHMDMSGLSETWKASLQPSVLFSVTCLGCTSVTPFHISICPSTGSHKNLVHPDGAGEGKGLQREKGWCLLLLTPHLMLIQKTLGNRYYTNGVLLEMTQTSLAEMRTWCGFCSQSASVSPATSLSLMTSVHHS